MFLHGEHDKPAVLIVEDEPDNFIYLEILLKSYAGLISHAENGRQAIEMAAVHHYDLILMDMKMPVMNGLEATEIIKRLYPEIPVIGQTACATRDEWDSAMAAGCDDLIIKPISRKDLLALLGKFITV